MYFTFQERRVLASSFVQFSRNAVAQRADFPEIDTVLRSIEEAVIADAMAHGASSTQAKSTTAEATQGMLANQNSDVDAVKEPFFGAGKRAVDRLRKLEETGAADPDLPETIRQLVPQSGFFGTFHFHHRLLQVRNITPTPPNIGKDEMLYQGRYTYAGGGGLLPPYYHEFAEHAVHTPNKTLVSVPIQYGAHRYTAKHFVTEEDVLSGTTARIIAVGVTLLLDLLIEAGILMGKAALRAWLRSQRPDGVSEAEWDDYIDKVLDGAEEEAKDLSDDLLGVLAEWLAAALGPEKFPLMTSSATLTWHDPHNWPVVSGTKVEGTGNAVRGKPAQITGPGTSHVMNVPLKRSAGGAYETSFIFDVSRHWTKWP